MVLLNEKKFHCSQQTNQQSRNQKENPQTNNVNAHELRNHDHHEQPQQQRDHQEDCPLTDDNDALVGNSNQSDAEQENLKKKQPMGSKSRDYRQLRARSESQTSQINHHLSDLMPNQYFNEALLAVASAEEYAAKILALQQACLRPLKEDLADWLNKIMSTSVITSDNFMHKLDNGVVICRLAKIISIWCLDKLDSFTISRNAQSRLSVSSTNVKDLLQLDYDSDNQSINTDAIENVAVTPLRQNPLARRAIGNKHHRSTSLKSSASQSTNCLNSQSILANYAHKNSYYADLFAKVANNYTAKRFLDNLIQMDQTKIWEDARCRTFYARDNVSNFIKWSKEFGVNQSVLFESDDLVLHANARQVVLCLLDVARIACVKYGFTEAPGLVKFEQEIQAEAAQIASSNSGNEDAYQRLISGRTTSSNRSAAKSTSDGDNDENDPDDKGAHCGPQLHKKQRAQEQSNRLDSSDNTNTTGANNSLKHLTNPDNNSVLANGRARLRATGARGRASIGDATDELILRYCMHKEEQQARDRAAAEAKKRQEEEEAEEAAAEAERQRQLDAELELEKIRLAAESLKAAAEAQAQAEAEAAARANEDAAAESPLERAMEDLDSTLTGHEQQQFEADSTTATLTPAANDRSRANEQDEDEDEDLLMAEQQQTQLKHCERVDSLDSGEGRTESASTSHTSRATSRDTTSAPSSRSGASSSAKSKGRLTGASSIPILVRRANSSVSLSSDPNTNSLSSSQDDLSSSRSSLLSGNEASSSKDHDPMDLDGKVMRIAKSYYGKGARRGVTRLSEGKYKIADRIVFVRLLKGHRVMVRIGGGWDTLENFLFRHKSDPSQVIDVDNLLPLEAKMGFESGGGGGKAHNASSQQLAQAAALISSNQQQQQQQSSPIHGQLRSHGKQLHYYKRSDSASSTNLSISNRSIANSPTSSSINSHKSSSNHTPHHAHLYNAPSLNLASSSSTPNSPIRQQIPRFAARSSQAKQNSSSYLLINRGQNTKPISSHQPIAIPSLKTLRQPASTTTTTTTTPTKTPAPSKTTSSAIPSVSSSILHRSQLSEDKKPSSRFGSKMQFS